MYKSRAMKKHLVNLLFEQYKLTSFVGKLSDFGAEIDNLRINNHEIILDIIGFPKDGQDEQSNRVEAIKALASYDAKNPPDVFFSREDLYDRYLTILVNLGVDESIVLPHNGLILKNRRMKILLNRN